MPLRETVDIHSENHTKNDEELCVKLYFLMLYQVMYDFKLGIKLLTGVLWFLCSEYIIMVLDIHLFANKPKDSQIALAVGFFL